MNKKRFRSSKWSLGWFVSFVLLLAVLLLIIPNVIMFVLFHDDMMLTIDENALDVIFAYTMSVIMIVIGIFLVGFWFFTINAYWCWLSIEEDRIIVNDGMLKLNLRGKKVSDHDRIVLEVMLNGFSMIAAQYKKNVKIIKKEN